MRTSSSFPESRSNRHRVGLVPAGAATINRAPWEVSLEPAPSLTETQGSNPAAHSSNGQAREVAADLSAYSRGQAWNAMGASAVAGLLLGFLLTRRT